MPERLCEWNMYLHTVRKCSLYLVVSMSMHVKY